MFISSAFAQTASGGDMQFTSFSFLENDFETQSVPAWPAVESLWEQEWEGNLLRAAVERFDLARVCARTGLAASQVTELLGAVRRHGRLSALTGTEQYGGPQVAGDRGGCGRRVDGDGRHQPADLARQAARRRRCAPFPASP